MTSGPLADHRLGEAPPRPDLSEPWRSDPRHATNRHLEGDAAALVREAVRDGATGPFSLYMNTTPCGARSTEPGVVDPFSCHENLRHIVPEGTRVFVYAVKRARPHTARFLVVGTGEAIA